MAMYLSVKEYAEAIGRDRANVTRMITSGRLPAIKIGNQWAVEEGTPWPADKRVKSGKYKDWRKPKSEAQTEE